MLLHFARALAVETVSIWGPTSPETRLRPTGTRERVAFAKMPCSPCIHVHEIPPCQWRRDCIAHAVDSLVACPQQGGAAIATPQPAGVVTGWDVNPRAREVRAASIHYA
jgi:hypothetical protein